MSSILKFASGLAKETGQILINYFNKASLETDIKADRTIVTEADLAADEKIRTAIQAAYPGEHLLTEESDTVVADIDTPVWVIDPLDGTTNFSLGLPIWGVSIARLENGMPQIGVLYFPVMDELYTAERGKGAHLNGQPLKTPPADQHGPYTFFTCCSRTIRKYDVSLRYKTRVLGSAVYDFCTVARGSALMGFQATLKIWDLAAGWLLLEEAGGTVDILSGPIPFPIQPKIEYNQINYPTILAADPKSALKVKKNIKKKG